MSLSALRLLGILIGLSAMVLVWFRQRSAHHRASGTLAIALLGFGLILVGLFPEVTGIVQAVVFPDSQPGPRLLSLAVASLLALWLLVLWERAKSLNLSIAVDKTMRSLVLAETQRGNDLSQVPKGAILLVIPAFNEAENLAKLLPIIPKEVRGHPVTVLVVDDGSEDATAETARSLGALVASHPINRGYGTSVRTGYGVAGLLAACAVVTLDADGQHKPDELAIILEPILEGEADICIGSRVLGSHEPVSPLRTFGVWFFCWVINVLMGTRITDCSSGYRAFSMQALKTVRLIQDRYHTAELIIDAHKRRLRLTERPITILRRMTGESKKPADLIYGLNFLRVILSTWLR